MNNIKVLSLSLATLLISACSSNMETVLPDDPTNEPQSTEQPSVIAPDEGEDVVVEIPDTGGGVDGGSTAPSYEESILAQYAYIDTNHVIPTAALKKTLIYFHENKSKFSNRSVISLLDYSQKSTNKRWHFIDMTTGKVSSLHVSHGKGSDANHDGYAEKFSNVSGSNATSLGFYKTAETYTGSNGYSLRLDGLSSTNSNARARAVVVHGADYVQDTNVIQGRSWGCPAVSRANAKSVINWLKGGSLIYAFN
jgi:hypothetical protein